MNRPVFRNVASVVVAIGYLVGSVVFAAADQSADKPNIILVLTDDQGIGDLSCMGNTILSTPRIDALYEKATRFTDFQVSPTCAPTRAAIMSGWFPFEVGVSHTLMQRERLAPTRYYGASVRTAHWRLVYEMDGEEPWLSDIVQDPGETRNLINEFPQVAQKLKADFDNWWDSTEAFLVNEGLPRLRPGEYPLHLRYAKQLQQKGVPDWQPKPFEQEGDGDSSVVAPAGWQGKKSDWNGFRKVAFQVDGKPCFVVLPDKEEMGKPWAWRARFPTYHPEVDMTQEKGLAGKVALEAVSRGGLFAYRWAARNPDAVACLYADVPVCDFKSWPLGQGSGIGNHKTWLNLLKQYEFTEKQALA